jgi:hypothetical protein
MTNATEMVQRLLHPVALETFMGTNWERNFYRWTKADGRADDTYSSILTQQALREVLVKSLATGAPALKEPMRQGEDVILVNNGVRSSRATVTGKTALRSMTQDGDTLVLQAAQYRAHSVAQMAEAFEEVLGFSCAVSAHLTPAGGRGLALQYDDTASLVMQAEGRQHWVVYKPLVALPRVHEQHVSAEELAGAKTEVVWDGVLEAGEMLHLPRGWPYEAVADGGSASMHLAVQVSVFPWQTWEGLLHCGVTHLRPPANADTPKEHKLLSRPGLLPCYSTELAVPDGTPPGLEYAKALRERQNVAAFLEESVFEPAIGKDDAKHLPDGAGLLHMAIRCTANDKEAESNPLRQAVLGHYYRKIGRPGKELAEGWAAAVNALCGEDGYRDIGDILDCTEDRPGLGGEFPLGGFLASHITVDQAPRLPKAPLVDFWDRLGEKQQEAVQTQYSEGVKTFCKVAWGPMVRGKALQATATLRNLWRTGAYGHWEANLEAHGEAKLQRLSDNEE